MNARQYRRLMGSALGRYGTEGEVTVTSVPDTQLAKIDEEKKISDTSSDGTSSQRCGGGRRVIRKRIGGE